MPRARRTSIIIAARTAAARGDHGTAVVLFALVGMAYVVEIQIPEANRGN